MSGLFSGKRKPSLSSSSSAPSAAPAPAPAAAPPKALIIGIDTAHWQAGLDFTKVKALGYDFVYAKATDGAKVADSFFKASRAQALAAGLIFGAYHFFRFDDDPIAQVQNLLTVAGQPQPGDLPHALDIEWDNNSSNLQYRDSDHGGVGIMDAAGAALAAQSVSALSKAMGIPPVLYTNPNFFVPGAFAGTFMACPLWGVNGYNRSLSQIKIAKPWTKMTFWQSENDLNVGGITEIDVNQFLGSEADLAALLKK